MLYKEKLLHPKWQKKRLIILQRDGFKCTLCGDDQTTLHVHHEGYEGYKNPWDYEDDKLKTLCSDCHLLITAHGQDDIRYLKVYKSVFYKKRKVKIIQAGVFSKTESQYGIAIFRISSDINIQFLELFTEREFSQTINLIQYINSLRNG